MKTMASTVNSVLPKYYLIESLMDVTAVECVKELWLNMTTVQKFANRKNGHSKSNIKNEILMRYRLYYNVCGCVRFVLRNNQ